MEIFEDDSPLRRGLTKTSTTLKAWGASITGIGAGITGGITAGAIGGFAALAAAVDSTVSPINDMSQRTGLAVDTIAELGFAAQQTGASTEDLETGVKKMQKTIAEAAAGSKEARDTLTDLGLSLDSLSKMTAEQQLDAVANSLSAMKNPAQRTAAAMSLFGKSGSKLIPLMADGAKGMAIMRKRAKDLGITMDTDTDAAGDALGDALNEVRTAAQFAAVNLASAFLPQMVSATTAFADGIGVVSKWVKENRGVVLAAIGGAAAVAALGVAMVATGVAITTVGTIIGAVSAGIGLIGSAIGFLATPTGLAVAALGGLAAYFVLATDTGKQTLGALGTAFGVLTTDATSAWGGIIAALQAGDFQAAFGVVTSFMELEWTRITTFLMDKWTTWTNVFRDLWADAVGEVAKGFINLDAAAEIAFVGLTGFTDYHSTFQSAWDGTLKFVIDQWRELERIIGSVQAVVRALVPDLSKAHVNVSGIAQTAGGLLLGSQLGPAGNIAAGFIGRNLQNNSGHLSDVERQRQLGLSGVNFATGAEKKLRANAADAARSDASTAVTKAEAKLADAVAKGLAASPSSISSTGSAVAPEVTDLAVKGIEKAHQASLASTADVRSKEGLTSLLTQLGTQDPQERAAKASEKAAALLASSNTKHEKTNYLLDRIDRDLAGDTLGLDQAATA